jgi:hypothetical protein
MAEQTAETSFAMSETEMEILRSVTAKLEDPMTFAPTVLDDFEQAMTLAESAIVMMSRLAYLLADLTLQKPHETSEMLRKVGFTGTDCMAITKIHEACEYVNGNEHMNEATRRQMRFAKIAAGCLQLHIMASSRR